MKYKLMAAVLTLFILVPAVQVRAQTNEAAGIIIEPSQSTDGPFRVEVYAGTGGEEINAVEFTVVYSDDTLRFDSFDSSDSDYGIEAPNASGTDGTAIMSRASIEPRNSERSLVTVMNFTPIAAGNVTLTIGQDSRLLRFTDSENIIGTVQQYDGDVSQGGGGLQASTGTTTVQVVEDPVPSFSDAATDNQGVSNDDSEQIEDAVTSELTDEEIVAGADAQSVSATGESESSSSSQVVVGGVAILGLLLVVFGYIFTKMSSRRGNSMHAAAPSGAGASGVHGDMSYPVHGSGSAAPTVQQPTTVQPGSAPSQGQPVNSGSAPAGSISELDELLNEVHGAEAKDAKVVGPKKIDIS